VRLTVSRGKEHKRRSGKSGRKLNLGQNRERRGEIRRSVYPPKSKSMGFTISVNLLIKNARASQGTTKPYAVSDGIG